MYKRLRTLTLSARARIPL